MEEEAAAEIARKQELIRRIARSELPMAARHLPSTPPKSTHTTVHLAGHLPPKQLLATAVANSCCQQLLLMAQHANVSDGRRCGDRALTKLHSAPRHMRIFEHVLMIDAVVGQVRRAAARGGGSGQAPAGADRAQVPPYP